MAFTQHEAHYANWIREYQLQKGKNVLTVPEIYSTSWENKTVKGGALYLINRYTKEDYLYDFLSNDNVRKSNRAQPQSLQ